MSLSAFNSGPGYHEKWYPFEVKCVNPDGSTWQTVEWVRTDQCYKPEWPNRPEWVRVNGAVAFKKPSQWRREVFKRTNPYFTNSQVKSDGTYYCTLPASWRTGNHPDLLNMPGVMQNSSMSPEWDSNAENRAVVECYLKIKDQKASIGAALAEATQTADMLADTAKQLAKLLINARRGNWKGVADAIGLRGREALRLPSNYYLQWQYGWSPLMHDIRDAHDLLKEKLKPLLPLIHAKRTIESKQKWDHKVPGNENEYNTVRGEGTHTTKVELWVTCNADPWRQAALQMGLDDPLGILWELTPYSFVVDWIAPVGDLLSALSVRGDLSLIAGYVSMKGQGSITISHPGTPDPSITESVPDSKCERFGFVRAPYYSLPMPLPYVKSPFSTSHTKSALALLGQLIGR